MAFIHHSSFSLNPLKNFSFKNFSWEKPVPTRVQEGQESKFLVIGAKTGYLAKTAHPEVEFIVAPNTFYGRTLWFLFGSSKQINKGINHAFNTKGKVIKPSFFSPTTLADVHQFVNERDPENRESFDVIA